MSFFLDPLGDTMRTKNKNHIVGHITQGFYENSPSVSQVVDDMPIVHNFMPHIDRRSIKFKGSLYNFYSSINASAKTSRIS